MPQTLKREVRDRILAAAEREFYDHGFDGATMAGIAKRAGTAGANVYRYFEDKAALFEAVITVEFVERHDELVVASVEALARPDDDGSTAEALLEFWLSNRRRFVTLLEHRGPTRFGTYPDRFVERLVDEFESSLTRELSSSERTLCRVIFENTRRALTLLLRSCPDDEAARHLIRGFWSYQVPGLEGLQHWIEQPEP
ncbi:MAG: TetR/AcrR family transcriptional regulator [Acidimicrobiia bacterium]